ncbi:MAG: cyclic pyranopterin phosphate synthase MoaA, partial [Prochlorococcaceae cyanobacterium]
FCGDCNRLRVTADGIAYGCLFATSGTDLKPWLRPALDAPGLAQALGGFWGERSDRWSEQRQETQRGGSSERAAPNRAEMAYLGG